MKPIGHYDIERARASQARGSGLHAIAALLSCTEKQADLVLWTKVGRSLPLTVDIVNSPGWQARAA